MLTNPNSTGRSAFRILSETPKVSGSLDILGLHSRSIEGNHPMFRQNRARAPWRPKVMISLAVRKKNCGWCHGFNSFIMSYRSFALKGGVLLAQKGQFDPCLSSLFSQLPWVLTVSPQNWCRKNHAKTHKSSKIIVSCLEHPYSWPPKSAQFLGFKGHVYRKPRIFPWGTPGFPNRSRRNSVRGLHCQAWDGNWRCETMWDLYSCCSSAFPRLLLNPAICLLSIVKPFPLPDDGTTQGNALRPAARNAASVHPGATKGPTRVPLPAWQNMPWYVIKEQAKIIDIIIVSIHNTSIY